MQIEKLNTGYAALVLLRPESKKRSALRRLAPGTARGTVQAAQVIAP